MSKTYDLDPATLLIKIHEGPIKNTGEITLSRDDLERQAEYIRQSVVAVDYSTARGTCGDERERAGLKNGEEVVEPRPSVWGGPDIFGLSVSEMAGAFAGSTLSPDERLIEVHRDLKRNKIPSGGHEHCAAAGSFGQVLANVAANPETAHAYAKANMDNYDQEIMDEVLNNARAVVESGVYEGWNGEESLASALGDDAGEAIEKLAPGPHKGKTFVRTHLKGVTVDQTTLHKLSGGEDTFVQDDAYADTIENALASGPEAAHMKRLMEHAREALLVGVSLAVPNPEIHQIDIS